MTNFDLDASNFKITAPSTTGTFSTQESFVTIRGVVNPGVASTVKVNDYQLASFRGTTWRYHASEANNNLKIGSNIYEIKYFDESGKLIFTQYFTIIRKDPNAKPKKTSVPKKQETKPISSEA